MLHKTEGLPVLVNLERVETMRPGEVEGEEEGGTVLGFNDGTLTVRESFRELRGMVERRRGG